MRRLEKKKNNIETPLYPKPSSREEFSIYYMKISRQYWLSLVNTEFWSSSNNILLYREHNIIKHFPTFSLIVPMYLIKRKMQQQVFCFKDCSDQSQAGRHFYGFGLILGQLAILQKIIWADYEQLLRAVFSCFQGQNCFSNSLTIKLHSQM